MARRCSISGKSRQCGNRVSHAKNRRRHVFKANLQTRRVFIPSENRKVRIKVSTRMIRIIDRIGIEEALKKHGKTVQDILA